MAVSGPGAFAALQQHVKIASESPELNRIYYGQWLVSGHQASEQVVLVRTSQDSFEIHCHGGNAICRRILDDLQSSGCAIVAPKNWVAPRSDGQGTTPASAIEHAAEHDLLRVTTDRAAMILLDQLAGALATAIEDILSQLASGEHVRATRQLDTILLHSRIGLHLANPWRVVLAGPPNTGKSSLINAIVGWQQSIVHEEAGTTRDWVESQCAIGGWPVCLSDTAGIRPTDDVIESAGVERARLQIVAADLVVAVVDATVGWQTAHEEAKQLAEENGILWLVAWNKSDLTQAVPRSASQSIGIATSAIGEPGTEELLSAISNTLVPAGQTAALAAGGVPVPFRANQVRKLELAREHLRQVDVEQAKLALNSIFSEA